MNEKLALRLLLALGSAVFLAACGGADVNSAAPKNEGPLGPASTTLPVTSPVSIASPVGEGPHRLTADEIAVFPDFPIYSVGESFEGLPLTETLREKTSYLLRDEDPTSQITIDRLYLIYGPVCKDPLLPDCYPRVAIQITPACHRNRSMYDGPADAHPIDSRVTRGVPADEFPSSLALYTGSVAVVIHTNPADAKQAERAATALAPANDLARAATAETLIPGDLPPAAPGAAEGQAPC